MEIHWLRNITDSNRNNMKKYVYNYDSEDRTSEWKFHRRVVMGKFYLTMKESEMRENQAHWQ